MGIQQVSGGTLAAVMLFCGCTVPEDSERTEVATFQITTSVHRPSEDPLLAISEMVSQFAGYYCAGGDLHVGVTASTSGIVATLLRTVVEESGAAFYCRNRETPNHAPTLVLEQMKYSYRILRGWRDSVTDEFFERPGARALFIDFATNALVFETLPEYRSSASTISTLYQLPNDGVDVRDAEGQRLTAACPPAPYNGPYLSNCFRPVPAGAQFSASPYGSTINNGGATLTAAATRGSAKGWVTCSHNLAPTLALANTYVYQPGQGPGSGSNDSAQLVGFETVDPPGWVCGSYECRYSDSAWITNNQVGAPPDQGTIAQTLNWVGSLSCCDSGCASCATNTGAPRFHVYGPNTVPVGTQVEKIGRNSGWTTGTVSAICIDELDGQGHKYICNNRGTNLIGDGDSGSPVFYWWSSYGVNTVELLGIVWGSGGPAGGGASMLYSPWQNVVNDLGTIDVKFKPTWQQASESANDVSVGSNGHVWIISDTHCNCYENGYLIKRRLANGTWDAPGGGHAVRIAVDPSGNAWVVTGIGQIWRWTGSAWTQLPGTARDIGIGANGSVWIVGTTPTGGGYTIGVWNGSSWTVVAGGALRIAVDPSGNPWVTANDYTIWRRVGSTWHQVSGLATDIGIAGDGMVWVTGTTLGAVGGGYEIFWWSGIDWQIVPAAAATSISAARGGKLWVTNSIKALWHGL